jgi:death on curing protein
VTCRFLAVEAVEALHTKTIDRFGGSHGLRDRGLLESAVARAENLAYYNPDASIGELAATLGWGLIKNHAFIDGNKRVGAISLITFLDANGHRLTCTEAEETAMVLRAAAGETTETEWTAGVMANVAPIG